MTRSATIKLGQRGVLTLPKELREQHRLAAGDDMTLIDLDGVFVLSPRRSEIDALADRLGRELGLKGGSLESMLAAVREERERYGRKHR